MCIFERLDIFQPIQHIHINSTVSPEISEDYDYN